MKEIDYSKRPTGAIHPDYELDKYLDDLRTRKCSNCGKTIFKEFFSKRDMKYNTSTIPFRCSYCGKEFCMDCRLPENHSCVGGITDSKWFESEVPKYRKQPQIVLDLGTIDSEKVICQHQFHETVKVYKCPKCNLKLCEKHLSNHNCIKSQEEHKVEQTERTVPQLKTRGKIIDVYRSFPLKSISSDTFQKPISNGLTTFQKSLLLIMIIGFLVALYGFTHS